MLLSWKWHRIIWRRFTNASEAHTASIFSLDIIACLCLSKKKSNLELRFCLLHVCAKNRFLMWCTHFESGKWTRFLDFRGDVTNIPSFGVALHWNETEQTPSPWGHCGLLLMNFYYVLSTGSSTLRAQYGSSFKIDSFYVLHVQILVLLKH